MPIFSLTSIFLIVSKTVSDSWKRLSQEIPRAENMECKLHTFDHQGNITISANFCRKMQFLLAPGLVCWKHNFWVNLHLWVLQYFSLFCPGMPEPWLQYHHWWQCLVFVTPAGTGMIVLTWCPGYFLNFCISAENLVPTVWCHVMEWPVFHIPWKQTNDKLFKMIHI